MQWHVRNLRSVFGHEADTCRKFQVVHGRQVKRRVECRPKDLRRQAEDIPQGAAALLRVAVSQAERYPQQEEKTIQVEDFLQTLTASGRS